jgi:hypothetical protein
MAPQQYVADIKARLVASAAVATITIVEERLLPAGCQSICGS